MTRADQANRNAGTCVLINDAIVFHLEPLGALTRFFDQVVAPQLTLNANSALISGCQRFFFRDAFLTTAASTLLLNRPANVNDIALIAASILHSLGITNLNL